MSENGLLSSKNSIVERDSIQEHPEFHPRSRLSEKGSESTYFFHYTLAWARYVAKFCINLLYLLDSKPTIHSIHKFINLHITLIVPAQNYTSTFIESLIYFVNLYIYMIYKSKSFKTKPSILNHNTFNFNQITIYSKQEILQTKFGTGDHVTPTSRSSSPEFYWK